MVDNFGIRTYSGMSSQIFDYSLILSVGMESSDLYHLLLLPLWPDAGGPDPLIDNVALISVQKLGDVYCWVKSYQNYWPALWTS